MNTKTKEVSIIKHNRFSIIKRKKEVYHRIERNKETITLFIAIGKYKWNAINPNYDTSNDGIFMRIINGKEVWSKKENGIWFIGNKNKEISKLETKHSINQK